MNEKKKMTELDVVRARAKFNYHRHLEMQEQDRKFKEQLDAGIFDPTPTSIEDSKGVKK